MGREAAPDPEIAVLIGKKYLGTGNRGSSFSEDARPPAVAECENIRVGARDDRSVTPLRDTEYSGKRNPRCRSQDLSRTVPEPCKPPVMANPDPPVVAPEDLPYIPE